MPTKRRKVAPKRLAIPPEALEAWRAGDERALHRALGLGICHLSPFPRRLTLLGVDPDDPQPVEWAASGLIFYETWHHAVELQKALTELAGDPPDALLPLDENPRVVPLR